MSRVRSAAVCFLTFGASLAAALALALAPLAASAQASWPTRTIRLVVPFGSGGPVDFSTRLVAGKVAEQIGQSVIVENRAGGSGNIGAGLVAQAAPDGYTFLVTGVGPLAINPHLLSNVPFDTARDFVPVVTVVQYPQVLAVGAKVPAKSIGELIALAKQKPDVLNYGSAGVGTSGHLITESFLSAAGIRMTHVPYKGGASTLQGMMSGDIDVVIDGLPSFMAHRESDRIRVLAVSSAERWPLAPDLPSLAEGAKVPGFDFVSWVMFVAPRGTPPEIADRFAAEVNKALADPSVLERLRTLGAMPRGGTPADAARFLASESDKWKRVVETSGAKPN
ncbi:MAG: Bug family tripartite tricarboxylate transporter substrate binding protein [Lautropia sp.]